MRLMKKYKDTPDWWYVVVFVAMIALSFGVVCGWPTGFPAWAYVICVSASFPIPCYPFSVLNCGAIEVGFTRKLIQRTR